jgi:succinyl-diaminopimelate desuccinylase
MWRPARRANVVAAKQGWTDVARLGEFSIPAINFGPGETALAHRPDESIDLGDLDRVIAGLRSALLG